MSELPRPKVWVHPQVLTEHVFDKLWALGLTLAEFRWSDDFRTRR